MKNIIEVLNKNQVVLGVMKGGNYNIALSVVPKKLASKGAVCYVTTNKTYASLQEIFKKKKAKIENMVFIDAISKSFKSAPNQSDSVYYVSSPGALTELSLIINKFLKHNFTYIIFDSITNLMIYNKTAMVHKFLRSLVNKIKMTDTRAIFFAMDVPEHRSMIKQCNMFFDKVVKCCD